MRTHCAQMILAAVLLGLWPALPAVAEEVWPGIRILNGIRANLPDDDLRPFKRTVGQAPVVASGESEHTTQRYPAHDAQRRTGQESELHEASLEGAVAAEAGQPGADSWFEVGEWGHWRVGMGSGD